MPWRPSGVPWSPPLCRWLLRGRRGTWCTAKGSDVCPGVPPVSLGLRRSAGGFCVAGAALGALQGVGCTPWRPSGVPWSPPLCRRRGTMCIAKGSDVRPGVPPVSLTQSLQKSLNKVRTLNKGSGVWPKILVLEALFKGSGFLARSLN